jgi:hypothetical protein
MWQLIVCHERDTITYTWQLAPHLDEISFVQYGVQHELRVKKVPINCGVQWLYNMFGGVCQGIQMVYFIPNLHDFGIIWKTSNW